MTGWVYDDTALIAWFGSHPRAFGIWKYAEAENVPIIVPAIAIYAANLHLRERESAWTRFVMGANCHVMELTLTRAVEASHHSNDPVIGQVTAEALGTDAVVITSKPLEYPTTVRTLEIHTF